MKGTLIIAGILCLGLIWGANASAQHSALYKWIDDKGITHYSARVPYGVDAELISIRKEGSTGPSQGSSASRERTSAMSEATKIREGQEGDADAKADREREQAANQAAENCRVAQERLNRYTDARRLYRPLPNGEREYLTDNEIDSERAAAIESVNKWCGNS